MRAALVHDALYQLMRNGKLEQTMRPFADGELLRILKEDGMWKVRRWWVFRAVRRFASKAGTVAAIKQVHYAP